MAMTLSKKAKMLSESICKVKAESDFNRKALAAEKLLDPARALRMHTARFTRITWNLDMLFFLFAVLVFNAVVYFEGIENILPTELRQIIEPIYQSYQSSKLTNELRQWLYCILGLLALPVVFVIPLAVVCNHTSVTAGKSADGAKDRVPKKWDEAEDAQEKLSCVQDMLDDVQKELNPTNYLPVGISSVAIILFLLPAVVMTCYSVATENAPTIFDRLLLILAGAVVLFLFLASLGLIFCLKQYILELFFSSWKCRKEAKELCDDFSKHRMEYKMQCDREQWLADQKVGAEIYKRATMGRTVDERLMAQAAEKHDPQANLYIGRKILERADAEGLTDREIAELCKKALHYLVGNSIPDAKLLCALAQLYAEVHDEYGWTCILRDVRNIDKTKLSRGCRDIYDDVVDQLIYKIDSVKVVVFTSDVVQALSGSSSGSYGSSGGEWDRMNDDLDAVRRARGTTRRYGEDWSGYDAEAPGPDPESFPDSSDIW